MRIQKMFQFCQYNNFDDKFFWCNTNISIISLILRLSLKYLFLFKIISIFHINVKKTKIKTIVKSINITYLTLLTRKQLNLYFSMLGHYFYDQDDHMWLWGHVFLIMMDIKKHKILINTDISTCLYKEVSLWWYSPPWCVTLHRFNG